MSLKTTAAALLAQLRATATPAQSAPRRSNTKSPIAQDDKATIREYIAKHEPLFMLAYHDLALETGWRTGDLAAIRYEAISWTDGTITTVVAKQSKAAEARAMSKGLREIQEARKSSCLVNGDAAGFMRWSVATRDQIANDASPAECDRLSVLIANAPKKIDTKKLSADLLARLAAMKAQAFWDDGFVFSRALTTSPRSRLCSGASIHRSTFWARFKAIFAAVAEQVQNASRLSCYSLRKTYAVSVWLLSGKSVAAVMSAFGHSSESMSLKYLGMDNEAAKAQALLVGRGTA